MYFENRLMTNRIHLKDLQIEKLRIKVLGCIKSWAITHVNENDESSKMNNVFFLCFIITCRMTFK